MNTAWGVYPLRGTGADGKSVSDSSRTASNWYLRWRVDGREHRRTFKQKGHASTFREQLLTAKVLGWPADHRGWPLNPTHQIQQAIPDPKPPPTTHGPTFEAYCNDTWYPNNRNGFEPKNRIGHRANMRFAIRVLRYTPGDPRLMDAPQLRPGNSILLKHLVPDDVLGALATRATTNDRTAAVNQRTMDAAHASGTQDISLRAEVSQAATIRAFYITLAMILRAGQKSHVTITDPLDGTSRAAPKPKHGRISNRIVPSIDEVFALADAIAKLGPLGRDGRPAGERFRSLILCAGTLAPRPGELTAHRPDWIDWNNPMIVRFHETEAPIYDTEEGLSGHQRGPLKHRVEDDFREVPALSAVADALKLHIERGYSTPERTWTGAGGSAPITWGNLRDTYWRPACEKVFARGDKARLVTMTPQILRKAAITFWLDSGISPVLAAEWAGHSEDVARRYYAGRTSITFAREAAVLGKGYDAVIFGECSER